MRDIHDPNHPVILFIPETGVYPFARALSILGSAVMKKGGRVLITRHRGAMFRCNLMAKTRMHPDAPAREKTALCRINIKRVRDVVRKYGFSIIDLDELADTSLISEINNLVDSADVPLNKIVFRGFPVGAIAEYDFILESKSPFSDDLPPDKKSVYAAFVKNTALSVALADKICEIYKPSLFLTFNEYAQCQAVRWSAATYGVRRMAITYPVNFNVDGSRLSIWESTCEYWRYRHCQMWAEGRDTPIDPSLIIESWQDSLFRMYGSGSHIFSSRKNSDSEEAFKKLGLNPKRKTVVVYTSSEDERSSVEIAMKFWGENAGVVDAFPRQIDWLGALREHVAGRDDIQIVVRIHPREGSRQFGFDSSHLNELRSKLGADTDSFKTVWPDDAISSYDLMELADVCLVAWSLMGQEAAKLGIPVLTHTGNMFYPDDDFIQVGRTPTEYMSKLDAMLSMRYGFRHILKSARFYHWRIFLLSLDLRETVPRDFKDDNIWPDASPEKIGVINDILSGQKDLVTYNIKRWRDSITSDSNMRETEAMHRGMRMFIDALFYPPPVEVKKIPGIISRIYRKAMRVFFSKNVINKDPIRKPFIDYKLEYDEDASNLEAIRSKTETDPGLRYIVADGLYAILVHNGKLVRKMSPLAIRLAKLHAEH